MSKIEEYKSELVRIQDIAILDTVDLVERANGCDKETKVRKTGMPFGFTSLLTKHLLSLHVLNSYLKTVTRLKQLQQQKMKKNKKKPKLRSSFKQFAKS